MSVLCSGLWVESVLCTELWVESVLCIMGCG